MRDSYYLTKPITSKWLEKNNFKFSNIYSTKDNGNAYYCTFPCYYWNNHIILFCETVVWEDDKKVIVNVFSGNYGRSKYAPFYVQCSTHKKLLTTIDNNIDKILFKMGFKRYDNDNNEPMRKVHTRHNRRRKQGEDKGDM